MKYFKRIIFLAAACVWLAFIFSNSLKPSKVSQNQSDRYSNKITLFINEHVSPSRPVSEETVSLIIRKTAHFTEFLILGFLLSASAASFVSARPAFIITLTAGAISAISDEIIQLYVPGRACMVSDMLIDFSGVLTASLLLFFILRNKIKPRRTKL
ncbi:MAG: VanZ family protein [Oscillospiraceae bacterium]|nr:VanZ family protein [Oscillospiraceae bacterium]